MGDLEDASDDLTRSHSAHGFIEHRGTVWAEAHKHQGADTASPGKGAGPPGLSTHLLGVREGLAGGLRAVSLSACDTCTDLIRIGAGCRIQLKFTG